MKFKAFVLRFKRPFRIPFSIARNYGTPLVIPAFYVAGGIFLAWAKLGKRERIEEFSEANVRVSSAFPILEGVPLFYKPRWLGMGASEDVSVAKKVKRLKFVPKDVFERLIAGDERKLASYVSELEEGKTSKPKGIEWERVRVALDRLTMSTSAGEGKGAIFFDRVGGCKEYFFLIDADERWAEEIGSALEFYKYDGWGGARTVGYGQVESVKGTEIEIAVPENAPMFITLSPFVLKGRNPKEVEDKGVFWGIVRFRGWGSMLVNEGDKVSYVAMRKRTVRMLSEGSIFKEKVEGEMVDAIPDSFREEYGRRMVQEKSVIYAKPFWLPVVLKDTASGGGRQ